MNGTAAIVRANARHLPLADNTVDLVVTSPPYFGLRSYQDGGEHYAGQIGDEPTPAEFLDALIEVMRECVRVLKPSGSIFVNLGDKYSQRPGQFPSGNAGGGLTNSEDPAYQSARRSRAFTAMQPKSLLLIPERFRIACIDQLGLIARAVIIWSKPNGLPESVTDRVRRSHEDWVHFTKLPRYYSAVDRIREQSQDRGPALSWQGRKERGDPSRYGEQRVPTDGAGLGVNPLGKLPGSVWTIPTEPLQVPDHLGVDHFAAFPTEWPRRIIRGWSPAGVCTACGEGRRPVSETTRTFDGESVGPGEGGIFGDQKRLSRNAGVGNWRFGAETTITGEACACPDPTAPTTPSIILDPFGGTGTTALVAKALGRHGITIDMSNDYNRLARWRCNDPKELAKAARKPFTASQPPMDGQGDLLSLLAEETP